MTAERASKRCELGQGLVPITRQSSDDISVILSSLYLPLSLLPSLSLLYLTALNRPMEAAAATSAAVHQIL